MDLGGKVDVARGVDEVQKVRVGVAGRMMEHAAAPSFGECVQEADERRT